MTDILVYIEAVCIMAGRFLILYAVFCIAKTFWKQFRHAANKIYSHVTGGCRIIISEKTVYLPGKEIRNGRNDVKKKWGGFYVQRKPSGGR